MKLPLIILEQVELKWKAFETWSDVIENSEYEFPCVYVLADRDGKPLYIGKATQERRTINGKLWAGELRARYHGAMKVLNASMKGTGRSIYITRVESKERGKVIEAQLIFENAPIYNDNQKKNPPENRLDLKHSGTHPKFKER